MKKRKRSYRYFFQYLGTLFFLLILLILLLNAVIPQRSFSEKENRVLSSRPKVSLTQIANGKFSSKYESYVNDQFMFRDFWVTLKAGTDRLMGKVEGNGVYICKDGYLMEAFTPPTGEQLQSTINAMTAFADNHSELKQYALIAPNAVTILKDKLPAAAPVVNQQTYLNQLKESLEAAGITFIDVSETLSSHKDENIYYRTDHHWTTQGAYYAYLTAAGIMDLDTSSASYEKLPVSYSFQGTLSAKSGFRSGKKEELDVFLPDDENAPRSVVNYVDQQKKTASFYSTEQLKGRDKYALFFDGNHAQVKISTPVEDDCTLLVLKDSYANCFVPFLAAHYRSIIMIDPRYYYGDLEELIQVEGVDEVLYLYNANTFFSDSSLELTLTPQQKNEGSTAS